MVAQEIVRLHNLDVGDPRRRQNFPGGFRAGDVRAGAHRAPFLEGAAHPELRDEPDDERNAHQQQPVRSETVSVNVSKHDVVLNMKRSRRTSTLSRGASTSLNLTTL